MLNIATNAIDACDERDDGIVTISTRQLADEGLVQIVVDDNGVGIPPEDLDKIFTIFVSSKGGRGTGLGLPSAKRFSRSTAAGSSSKAAQAKAAVSRSNSQPLRRRRAADKPRRIQAIRRWRSARSCLRTQRR